MSDVIVRPDTFDQLVDAARGADLVLPVGQRTKPPLSAGTEATLISLSQLRGIIQYEPSEFTFTAWAGTPIAEVSASLAERNQYLPFDPLLVRAGATLGGTVAAGLSGPGRVRYGGLRDFLLGVRFLAGDGQLINAGGKVVKNAAGFDIPKLLVGSLGRLGAMTELTFKVFPQAPSPLRTYAVDCDNHELAIKRIVAAASSQWELDAIDYQPRRRTLLLRIGGPGSTNREIADLIRRDWQCELQELEPEVASELWTSIVELNWTAESDRQAVVKVPISPKQFLQLESRLQAHEGLDAHLGAAASVLWIAADSTERLDALSDELSVLGLVGLVVCGSSERIWLGRHEQSEMARAIKRAMDPPAKFPGYGEG